MAQADAKNGHTAEHIPDSADGIVDWLGVAGAIREEDAVGLKREHVFRGGLGGDNRHTTSVAR